MSTHVADFQVTQTEPARLGTGIRGIAPYQAYLCADGYLIIAASNDRLFVKLAEALGHSEWTADPRFSANPQRSENRTHLNELITAIVGRQPRMHWQRLLDDAGVPSAPIQSIQQVLAHPQTRALLSAS